MFLRHKSRFGISLLAVGLSFIYSSPSGLLADGDKNLNVSAKTSQDYDKLIVAIQRRDIAEVNALLDKGTDIECSRGDFGDTPLMQAASEDSLDMVELLVNRGANVNPKKTFHGRTPLTLAAHNGSLDVVKYLIEHGVDVNANCTEHGCSDYLAFEGIGPRNPTPLGEAAEGRKPVVVEFLIQHGAKVNGRDGSSYTPLMWACVAGDSKTVQMLLRYGADATLKTDQGQTAQSFAAVRNYTDILALLDAVGKK